MCEVFLPWVPYGFKNNITYVLYAASSGCLFLRFDVSSDESQTVLALFVIVFM